MLKLSLTGREAPKKPPAYTKEPAAVTVYDSVVLPLEFWIVESTP
jgi:hypothetical protein